MNFYKELQLIIEANNPSEKLARFDGFYLHFQEGKCSFVSQEEPLFFQKPSYTSFCKVVSPRDVPKRGNLTTKEGQINLVHAIAHIEYSAIDLALDGAYRFRGLPVEFYRDWIEVAKDEIRHFMMLEKILNSLGATYGDVAVHDALFEASQKTQTLLERMAVVPRYLEANGLDATPMILEKLKKLPQDGMIPEIVKSLEIILQEEIVHVKKGDVWFAFACQKEKRSKEVFFEIIHKYYPRGFLRPENLNIEARQEAGFTCKELAKIANKEVC